MVEILKSKELSNNVIEVVTEVFDTYGHTTAIEYISLAFMNRSNNLSTRHDLWLKNTIEKIKEQTSESDNEYHKIFK